MKIAEVPVQKLAVWYRPDQVAPFQPSPYESTIVSVHISPTATGVERVCKNGAPPASDAPPEHESVQLISLGNQPDVTEIVCPGSAGPPVAGAGGGGLGLGGGGKAKMAVTSANIFVACSFHKQRAASELAARLRTAHSC